MKLDNIKIPPSLKEVAKQVLKRAILFKELQAGKYYRIEDICRQLNVSKTPVREALQDLEARGFVTLSPRKGVLINKMTQKDIIDFYQFRLVMESAVIELVEKWITAEDIDLLTQYTDQSKECIKNNDRMGLLEYDRKLHLYLARMTKNSFIIPQLERIRDFIDWISLLRPERMAESSSEHNRLIRCLSVHDLDAAKEVMKEHIEKSLQHALDNLINDHSKKIAEPERSHIE